MEVRGQEGPLRTEVCLQAIAQVMPVCDTRQDMSHLMEGTFGRVEVVGPLGERPWVKTHERDNTYPSTIEELCQVVRPFQETNSGV